MTAKTVVVRGDPQAFAEGAQRAIDGFDLAARIVGVHVKGEPWVVRPRWFVAILAARLKVPGLARHLRPVKLADLPAAVAERLDALRAWLDRLAAEVLRAVAVLLDRAAAPEEPYLILDGADDSGPPGPITLAHDLLVAPAAPPPATSGRLL